ncbi:hypothetical protein TWF281_001590 [Arthrobotrys megalospora]
MQPPSPPTSCLQPSISLKAIINPPVPRNAVITPLIFPFLLIKSTAAQRPTLQVQHGCGSPYAMYLKTQPDDNGHFIQISIGEEALKGHRLITDYLSPKYKSCLQLDYDFEHIVVLDLLGGQVSESAAALRNAATKSRVELFIHYPMKKPTMAKIGRWITNMMKAPLEDSQPSSNQQFCPPSYWRSIEQYREDMLKGFHKENNKKYQQACTVLSGQVHVEWGDYDQGRNLGTCTLTYLSKTIEHEYYEVDKRQIFQLKFPERENEEDIIVTLSFEGEQHYEFRKGGPFRLSIFKPSLQQREAVRKLRAAQMAEENDKLVFELCPSQISWEYKLAETTLDQMVSTSKSNPQIAFTSAVYGSCPKPPSGETSQNIKSMIEKYPLDLTQKQAIRMAMGTVVPSNIFILNGPPGTGKSLTLGYCIKTAFQTGDFGPILVCCDSNVALYRLLDLTKDLIPSDDILLVQSKRAILNYHEVPEYSWVASYGLESQRARWADNNMESPLAEAYTIALKEYYGPFEGETLTLDEIEDLIDAHIITKSQVVFSTLTMTMTKPLRENFRPTLLIVDEVASCAEVKIWYPVTQWNSLRRLILAGDPQQGKPRFQSEDKLLSRSLIHRLRSFGWPTSHLTVNHRLCSPLADLLRPALYKPLPGAAGPSFTDNPSVNTSSRNKEILGMVSETLGSRASQRTWVDIVGYDEQVGYGTYRNEVEAKAMIEVTKQLTSKGMSSDELVLLTPYTGQAVLLSELLKAARISLFVSSVDAFQGYEAKCILLSLVRSEDDGESLEMNFIADSHRLSIACSRASAALVIFGNYKKINEYVHIVQGRVSRRTGGMQRLIDHSKFDRLTIKDIVPMA